MASTFEIVAQAVKDASPDQYLSALYAPEDVRPALLALYAFHAEVAAVRDRTREALPGEVRLQWWHEVIDSNSTRTADGHPVAEALLEAITRYGLPRSAFANYLEARLFDLYNDPMPSKSDLEGYCGEVESAVVQLACMIVDAKASAKSGEMSGHAGCALGITRILNQLPLHRARGQCYVPADVLSAAGTTREEFLGNIDAAAAGRVVEAMLALASDHYAKFATAARATDRSLRPAWLALAMVPVQLSATAKLRGDALRQRADISPLRRQWTIFRAAMTNS